MVRCTRGFGLSGYVARITNGKVFRHVEAGTICCITRIRVLLQSTLYVRLQVKTSSVTGLLQMIRIVNEARRGQHQLDNRENDVRLGGLHLAFTIHEHYLQQKHQTMAKHQTHYSGDLHMSIIVLNGHESSRSLRSARGSHEGLNIDARECSDRFQARQSKDDKYFPDPLIFVLAFPTNTSD